MQYTNKDEGGIYLNIFGRICTIIIDSMSIDPLYKKGTSYSYITALEYVMYRKRKYPLIFALGIFFK